MAPAKLVLIVEDDWLLRQALVTAFAEAGWQVLEAAKGEDALAAAQATPRLDLLLTDIQLSGTLTGWDVADVLRAHHTTLPVLYVSATRWDPSRLVPGGLFFDKPAAVSALLAAARQLTR